MFRTYVRAASGSMIDFDRALLHMDGDLIDAVIAAMMHERGTCPLPDAAQGAQWLWDTYCRRHRDKYRESFGPDVIPDWEPPTRVSASLPVELDPAPGRPVRMIEAIASRLGFDVPREIRHSGRMPMFHTYVVAASGTVVDFDWAFFLMDRALLDDAIAALKHERDAGRDRDAARDAQWIWDDYCQQHRGRYGTPFGPDIIPGWDHPSRPDPLARLRESMPSGSDHAFEQDQKLPP